MTLLGYREGSIGRLMTPHYVRVGETWTISQVLDHTAKPGISFLPAEHRKVLDAIASQMAGAGSGPGSVASVPTEARLRSAAAMTPA